jgi:23S rRNA (uracil1939-C5)-methyltransferase
VASFSQVGKISQVDFCVDSEGRSSLSVHFSGNDIDGLIQSLQALQSDSALCVHIQTRDRKNIQVFSGSTQAITPEEDNTLQLGFPPGGFIQINLQQNRKLVSEVLTGAIVTGRERVLDLYAGIGNFSLPLARKCAEVVGVEEYEPAVAAAIQNARSNKLENVSFVAGRSERVIDRLIHTTVFDTVVLDPPRSGAAKVINSLLKLRPARIVYVSCDPTTLARDLVSLLAGGYRLLSARPIDMFPQTWHIEGVAVLDRVG